MKNKNMYKQASKAMGLMGIPDIKMIEKELLLGPSNMLFSEDMQTYIREKQGVQIQDLKSGEKIVVDISELVGKFFAVNADVDALRDAEQRALQLYAEDKASCIESYRQHLQLCQKHSAENMSSPAALASAVLTLMKEHMGITTDCVTLAALHQAIFEKPIRVFRAADILRNGNGSKHLSDIMRKLDVLGDAKEMIMNAFGGNIEQPMCMFRRDGSLYCNVHMSADDHETLDMSSVLRVNSRVSVLQNTLADVINRYQLMLRDNKKKSLQEDHRNIYQACMDFIKLRSKTITAKQWARFQEQCMKLVALRLVLYNKDIPYADKDQDSLVDVVFPKSQHKQGSPGDAACHGKRGEGSSSRQPTASATATAAAITPGHKDVGSTTSSGASGSGGFVRSAKAQELYGKSCLLGDASNQHARISFEDITGEPEITVMLKGVLDAELACVTNGKTLSQMLDQARKRCRSDQQGAKMICDHLFQACRHQDAAQLMDLLKIGCKGVLQKYEQLVTDCMQYLLLRCVVYNMPIPIIVGRAGLPPMEEADVVINNIYSEQDPWAVYLCDNLALAC